MAERERILKFVKRYRIVYTVLVGVVELIIYNLITPKTPDNYAMLKNLDNTLSGILRVVFLAFWIIVLIFNFSSGFYENKCGRKSLLQDILHFQKSPFYLFFYFINADKHKLKVSRYPKTSWKNVKGLIFGYSEQGNLVYEPSRTEANLAIWGSPGSMKTVSFVKPNARKFGGSVLTVDIKGDIYAYNRNYRKIVRFAPDIPNAKRDASAASIMASALIELSQLDPSEMAPKWLSVAEEQLRTLSSPAYLAKEGEQGGFILKHGLGHMPEKREVDVPLTYGDYYYVEALMRLKKLQEKPTGMDNRRLWVQEMTRIARPVLENLAVGTLKKNMPFESLSDDPLRREVSYLEAVGRTICGIAPWLELGPDDTEEGRLRAQYINLVTKGLKNAVNPNSPDHLMFDNRHTQPLVDAAFLAEGILRAPTQIWGRLDAQTRKWLIDEWKTSRGIKPYESIWLLFSSTIISATPVGAVSLKNR